MSGIVNLNQFDPFADATKGGDSKGQEGQVHIRVQQRNGRKALSTVQGLSDDYDKKKLLKRWKKDFHCNGSIVNHPEYGDVIQLQGDQRVDISDFLIKVGIVKKEQLIVHGY